MGNIRAVVPSIRYVLPLAWVSHCSPLKAVVLGDVMHISLLGQHVVILNSVKAVTDLFERRSALYSSRPQSTMASELYVPPTSSHDTV